MLENNAQQTAVKFGLCTVGTGLTNVPSHYVMLLITRKMAGWRFFEPGADVIGVPYGRHNAERGTAEGSIHFRHKLLECIFLRAEGACEIAVQAMRRPACMTELVKGRAVPVDGLEVGLRRRDLHIIVHRHIEGTLAADAKVDSGGFDQLLDCGLDQAWFRRRGPIVRHADYIGSWLELWRAAHNSSNREVSIM